MLVMTDDLQNFIDEQVRATTEETAFFIKRQIARFIEKDPDGTLAEAHIEPWYTSGKTPEETGDIVRLKFASHVIKALTIQRYIKESKTASYWSLITMYNYGTHWQQQTASGEIAYRVSKIAGEEEFKNWLENMSTLATKDDEINYLSQAATLFPGLEN